MKMLNISPLVTAVRTLTILPVPGRDAVNFADAIPYFPAVGALIGALIAGILYVLAPLGWPGGAGVLAATAAILLTRGLHVDGLADTADALGARGSRERKLAVMKDPHTGAFGVMAVTADFALKAAALGRIASSGHLLLLIVPFVAARGAQALVATTLPYARPEGGTAGIFVNQARPTHLVLALLMAAACSAVAGMAGILLLSLGLVLAVLIRLWMKHYFGGITGDLIGATNEGVESSLLVYLAFTLQAA